MLDGGTENERPTVAETYALAVGTSSLRMEEHRRGPAMIVAAAALCQQPCGIALERLRAEWDGKAKPPPALSEALLRTMAERYTRQDNGLVRITVTEGGMLVRKELLPLEAAKMEADAWHHQEQELLFLGLKSLPEVRDGLISWSMSAGIEEARHVVASVLQWWLHPVCQRCQRAKANMVAGSRRTPRMKCEKCGGTGTTKVPHGRAGQRVAEYIRSNERAATAGMAQSMRRMVREAPESRKKPDMLPPAPSDVAGPLLLAATDIPPMPPLDWMPLLVQVKERAAPRETQAVRAHGAFASVAQAWEAGRFAVVAYVHMALLDEAQAKVNQGGQTLLQLLARGGLAPCEALAIAERRRWRDLKPAEAMRGLRKLAQARARAETT
jgi:hypothetical protein